MTKNKVIVFDLDDTLYSEIDYVISAFHEIANILAKDYDIESYFPTLMHYFNTGKRVFDEVSLSLKISLNKDHLLSIYRSHLPNINLSAEVQSTLNLIKENRVKMGIITDGRSTTQRNKIRSLRLNELIDEDNIIISEEFGSTKPNIRNFEYFMNKYPSGSFTYVGDNPKKDFLAGNGLGWKTICLRDQGRNIHAQDFTLSKEYLPQIIIDSMEDLLLQFD